MHCAKTSILLGILLCITANSWAAQELILSYNKDANPPFVMSSDGRIDWEHPGITLEILKLLEARLNLTIKYKPMPSIRSMFEVVQNRVDGSFHWLFNEERAKQVHYPMNFGKLDTEKRLVEWAYYMYQPKTPTLTLNKSQIVGKGIIGVVRGSAAIDYIKSENISIIATTSSHQLLKMVLSNRINGAIVQETFGNYFIKKNPDSRLKLTRSKIPIKRDYTYLILSKNFVKKFPRLSENIWAELKNIRESGLYREIAKKYTY